MNRSAEELRHRIAGLREGEERMDQLDWMNRQWVASMMADASVIADELEERLERESPALKQTRLPNDHETARTD